ncbi:MAG: hypothetical protein ACKVQQ_04980 [Burkholderiales bacterium]
MSVADRGGTAALPRAARAVQCEAWWQAPEAQARALEAHPESADPHLRLRLAEGVLDAVVSPGSVLDTLLALWGECLDPVERQDGATRIACRVVQRPDADCIFLRLSGAVDFDLAEHAHNLLAHLYLGASEKYVEIESTSKPWRMFAVASRPGWPVIAVDTHRVLVDARRQPVNFVVHFPVSAVMRAQAGVIFVHAAAVAAAGAGVLIAGPSGAGKTTLALGLAARGHDFYSENVAGLRVGRGEVLPLRRTAFLRPGARSHAVGRVLDGLGVDLPDQRAGPVMPPKTPFLTTTHFPPATSAAVPLRYAFFLRGFAARSAVEHFSPTRADFERILRPLVFDILVAASWGAVTGWLIRHLQLLAMLRQAHCFLLDAGHPDETADLVAATVRGGV